MATRRSYLGSAPATTLSADITAGATSISVTSGSGLPASATVPAVYTIGRGTSGEERVLATRSGNVLTAITRGFDNTAAASHLATTVVEHTGSGVDLDEANAHTTATGAVHGLAGNVVGDTDAQTLTNKTLTSPTFAGTPVFPNGYIPAAAVAGLGVAGPADAGFAGWSFDPVAIGTGTQLTPVGGTVYLHRVTAVKAVTVTNLYVAVSSAGSGLTASQNFLGLYRTSGGTGGLNYTLASATADQSGVWNSTGVKAAALTSSQAVTAGEVLYVAMLSNGTTRPTVNSTANLVLPAGAFVSTVGITSPGSRFSTGPTAQTSLPASITNAGMAQAAQGAWVAMA